MNNFNISELEKQAQSLGATHLRHKFIDVSYYVNPNRVEVFSTHYFDSNDNEVAYIIDSCEVYKLTGLTIFETPRIWSTAFLIHRLTGDPIDFISRGIKHLNLN